MHAEVEISTITNKAYAVAHEQDAEAFMQRTCDIINAGAQSVMISIGHRCGLFDVMSTLQPSSSETIADSAELNERYVREWLAVMVTAGIVNYDAKENSYYLPRTHAACLTRDAVLGNAAVYAQFIPLIGSAQELILGYLESGGGTQYQDYPCFHHVMAEDSEQSVVAALFDSLLPLIHGIESRLQSGIDVLDAGCGKGRALIALAERFPQSRFTGYDLGSDAVKEANQNAAARGLQNIQFIVKDLFHLDEYNQYDLITTFDAIHDQRDPQGLILDLHRALKPSGVYLMQDIGGSAHLQNNLNFPMASLLYAISCAHCTPVSIGQGGEGLGTMWGWETAQAMLKNAGFGNVVRHVLPHDPMNVWFVSHRGSGHDE